MCNCVFYLHHILYSFYARSVHNGEWVFMEQSQCFHIVKHTVVNSVSLPHCLYYVKIGHTKMCSYHTVVMPQCGKNTHPKTTQETQCGKDMPFQISHIFKITPHCLPHSLPHCVTHSLPHCVTTRMPHITTGIPHSITTRKPHITTGIPHSNASYYHMNTIALPYTSATCCYMQFS